MCIRYCQICFAYWYFFYPNCSGDTQSPCLYVKVSPLPSTLHSALTAVARPLKSSYFSPLELETTRPPECCLQPARPPAQVPAPTTVAADWLEDPSAPPLRSLRLLNKWPSPTSTLLRYSWALTTSGSRLRSWRREAAVRMNGKNIRQLELTSLKRCYAHISLVCFRNASRAGLSHGPAEFIFNHELYGPLHKTRRSLAEARQPETMILETLHAASPSLQPRSQAELSLRLVSFSVFCMDITSSR